jgi:ABC-type glycerol-3-phosphate transport system permease component
VKRVKILNKALLYALVVIVALVLFLPLVMLLSYALRDNSEIITLDVRLFPKTFTTSAFLDVFSHELGGANFWVWFRNSCLTSGITALLATYIAALGGYGFTRYRFRGRRLFFFFIFFTQIMPWMVLLVPYYSLLVKTKMLNSLFSLGFSYLIINIPVSAWLFIGFFKNQPASLEEAARMDGCTILGAFHRIVLPLAIPSLSAIALFAFITGWGDFLFSSVIITSAKNLTLPLALQGFKGEHYILWSQIMAMASIMTIPIVALFLYLQKHMVNLMAGSIKE